MDTSPALPRSRRVPIGEAAGSLPRSLALAERATRKQYHGPVDGHLALSLALGACSECTPAALGKPCKRAYRRGCRHACEPAPGPWLGVGRRRSKARGFDKAGTPGQGPAGLLPPSLSLAPYPPSHSPPTPPPSYFLVPPSYAAGLGPSLPPSRRTWLRDTVPAGQGTGSSEPAGQ